MIQLSHLQKLEAEAIFIIREVVATCDKPVLLYSIGKDSAVLLHLVMKAFYPARPPFPLLHVDTTWKFREMIAFRDETAKRLGLDLIVHINREGVEAGINPFASGSRVHTDVMKTQGLKQALDLHRFDAAFGGARRDEEKSWAKERVFAALAGASLGPEEPAPGALAAFQHPQASRRELSGVSTVNWTERDVWDYIALENIPVVPLYFAAPRPVVRRDGAWIMRDDERMELHPGETVETRMVRFRTLGCYPLTGAVESEAANLTDIIAEMRASRSSERQGRVIDHDGSGSMEHKKQEGYF